MRSRTRCSTSGRVRGARRAARPGYTGICISKSGVARILHGYWRSSAAYRVRIALAIKRLEYETVFVNLRTGMQSGADFKSVNSQGFVPFLQDGEVKLRQSLAIIEYL